MPRLPRILLGVASILLIGGLLGAACGDPYTDCRFDPHCGSGGIGSFCNNDAECFNSECCESDNCGGGMCTFRCDHDVDCPAEMLCEHGTCFFICNSDLDCANGQSCEHGNTVCEWD
ncbi:MAG: hypothetical protein H6713_41640 [Myxococcales bacterium]|nr:hypothetical protein [Myxococcales bacterium]MCB9756467.1 hypothetical protein [Myxococcales bacterium]